MSNFKEKAKPISIVLIGTLILSLIGLYNGYPLVYSDTGTYIYSGFDVFVPNDRPVMYGLFLRFFSFKTSAWFVIFVQNLITSYVLYELFRSLYKTDRLKKSYLLITLFLVFFTGIGWYSNQLMPDFFAPIAIISLYLFLSGSLKGSIVRNVLVGLILTVSLLVHFSHLMIGTIMVGLALIVKLTRGKEMILLSLKNSVFLSLLVLSSWIILPFINYSISEEFVLSKGSHVFLLASLNEKGLVKPYLDKNCDQPWFGGNTLCDYKEELPTTIDGFIWSGDGIVSKTNAWEKGKQDFDEVIYGIHKDPGLLVQSISKSLIYGGVQLTRNKIGEGLSAYGQGSAPYGQIHWRFREELNDYLNSKQNKFNGQALQFDFLNKVNVLVLFISLAILVLYSLNPDKKRQTAFLVLFLLVGIVVNSMVTAGLSAPYDRYQARVVWMLPLLILIMLDKKEISIKL
ncbi:hypothetical protein [Salibacter halophilus]|uniref:Uncharacterized protein n=1 Tax=Salibacter halophilus TaxID=1803916 RepID=A0A6N6M6V8_9FLAO|nr:hypothetical protein [Salibacter halophilus]KAB1064333.1 hypothetical protein F3059_06425 [Salibacter halophilus]